MSKEVHDYLDRQAQNEIVREAQARHDRFVARVEQSLANQAEAGEFFKQRRAQADGIVCDLRDAGLI